MRSIFFQITMDGDAKRPFKSVISDFYKLHMNKGKEYTIKHSKKSVHRAAVYRWLKKFESTGNCELKPEKQLI